MRKSADHEAVGMWHLRINAQIIFKEIRIWEIKQETSFVIEIYDFFWKGLFSWTAIGQLILFGFVSFE